ncbi:MAG: contractile injection system tape measure protein [Bacteroidales bacterium]
MLPRNTHIIQKQSFEIGFENPENTLGLQDQIAQVFYENLQPRMEKMFDEMFDNDQYAIIERLDVDLGTLDPENWEQELTDRAIENLKISLATAQKEIINAQNYGSQRAVEIFFFYLENGFMPWNSRLSTTAELEKLLIVNNQLITRLMKLIGLKGLVAERLVYQFSEDFSQRVIDEIIPGKQVKMHEVLNYFRNLILFRRYLKLVNNSAKE